MSDFFGEQEITWEDNSRGFHGGSFNSNEICIWEDAEYQEKSFISLEVKQYTSDREDYFGVNVDAWEIYLWIRRTKKYNEGEQEYEEESKWLVGEEYSNAEFAKEFCQYIVYSMKKHGTICCLPFSKLVDD
jgi:hypothetical protein